jgi:hypothetical protein
VTLPWVKFILSSVCITGFEALVPKEGLKLAKISASSFLGLFTDFRLVSETLLPPLSVRFLGDRTLSVLIGETNFSYTVELSTSISRGFFGYPVGYY